MKVTLGKDGLGKTWQQEFTPTVECHKCKGEARIAFVAHEGIGEDEKEGKPSYVCQLHKNEGKGGLWLHDCCAVAVYFCRECLEPIAKYNQG